MTEYEKVLQEADSMLLIKSEATHKRYMPVLRLFEDFPTREDVVEITNEWLKEGQKGTTIHTKHAAIRWLMKHFPRYFNPVDVQETRNYMGEIKIKQYAPSVATPEQAEEIIANADSRTALAIGFLFYHGMRVSDVKKLRLDDFVETPDGKLKFGVDHQKNGQVRDYYVSDRVVPLFRHYVNGMRKDTILKWKTPKNSESLFLGTAGGLGKLSIQNNVTDACKACGYPELTCHSFRHGCATAYAKAGKGAEVIRYALGHKSIASSMRYIHLNADDLENASQGVFG